MTYSDIPLHKDLTLPGGRTIQVLRLISAPNFDTEPALNDCATLAEIQFLGGYSWERSTMPARLLLDLIEFQEKSKAGRSRGGSASGPRKARSSEQARAAAKARWAAVKATS